MYGFWRTDNIVFAWLTGNERLSEQYGCKDVYYWSHTHEIVEIKTQNYDEYSVFMTATT